MSAAWCERLAPLVDDGSLSERFARPEAYVTTGTATVQERPVAVVAVGAHPPVGLHQEDIEQVQRLQEHAGTRGLPLVYVFDAHVAPGLTYREVPDPSELLIGRKGWGGLYLNQIRLSGVVPQLALALRPMSGPMAFPAALCDALVMVAETSAVTLAPPPLVAALLGEEADYEALAGATMHGGVSGLCDAVVDSGDEAMSWARRYLALMPGPGEAEPPQAQPRSPATSGSPLARILPTEKSAPCDIHPVLDELVDADSALEIKPGFAREVVTTLARLEGRPVGIVANNSAHRGGILFPETCRKATSFIQLCDAFGLPLVFLADTVGFMVGTRAERAGIVESAARLFTAVGRASVPKVAVALRKAHTAALYGMCGPAFEPDAFLAVEGAAVSVFGSEAVAKLGGAEGPFGTFMSQAGEGDVEGLADRGLIDDVVPFERLRAEIANRLAAARGG